MRRKIHFGNNVMEFEDKPGSFLAVQRSLMEEHYSPLRRTDELNIYKAVPNDGKHNIAIVNMPERTITFHYTASDGRKQNKQVMERVRSSLESSSGTE